MDHRRSNVPVSEKILNGSDVSRMRSSGARGKRDLYFAENLTYLLWIDSSLLQLSVYSLNWGRSRFKHDQPERDSKKMCAFQFGFFVK